MTTLNKTLQELDEFREGLDAEIWAGIADNAALLLNMKNGDREAWKEARELMLKNVKKIIK